MIRYLVTGGAGFIGSHLISKLVKNSTYQGVVLDNQLGDTIHNLQPALDQVKFIQDDIRDADAVSKAMLGVDYVFHLAAVSSVEESFKNPSLTNAVNVNGTLNLLTAAKQNGIKRFVFASTAAIYGQSKEIWKSEEMPPDLQSPYAVSKRCGELYCHMFYKTYGLKTTIFRYFNVYGPGQSPDSHYASVIPKFIDLLRHGSQPTIFGDGLQSRDFIYIDDVLTANLLVCQNLNAAGQIYNIGTGISHTLLELLACTNQILGTNQKPTFAPARNGDVKNSQADISKAQRELNFKPEFELESGLLKTIQLLL